MITQANSEEKMLFKDHIVTTRAAQIFVTTIWFCQPLRAAQYLIDIGGSSPPMSWEDETHELRVSGTIDVDVPTDAISFSSLWFHHHTDPPIPLDSAPLGASDVDFVDVSGSLLLAFNPSHSITVWEVNDPAGPTSISFNLQSGGGISFDPIVNLRFDKGHVTEPMYEHDGVTFYGNKSPIKLGIAVPEPSGIVFSLVGLVAASLARGNGNQTRHATFCAKAPSNLVEISGDTKA